MTTRRKIPLGAKVRFTKRASGWNRNKLYKDVRNDHWTINRILRENQIIHPREMLNGAMTGVVVWPEQGEGTVVGHTFRHTGRQEWEDGFMIGLSETAPRTPLYQVKDRLSQVEPYLVPHSAIEWIDNELPEWYVNQRDEDGA